jgi:hypothetical protein
MLQRSTLVGFALLAVLGIIPTRAHTEDEQGRFDAAAAKSVAAMMDRDPILGAVYGQCPADLFRRRTRILARQRSERGPENSCHTRVQQCFEACTAGDGESCFRLARSFQGNPEQVGARHYETLFALACAAGKGYGCTNRAAGIRNGDYADDPFRHRPEAEKESCQFRSFTVACREGDSWGCAMLGRSYHSGEGTRRSLPKARGAYAKTCRLAPDFESCDFARENLQQMRSANR